MSKQELTDSNYCEDCERITIEYIANDLWDNGMDYAVFSRVKERLKYEIVGEFSDDIVYRLIVKYSHLFNDENKDLYKHTSYLDKGTHLTMMMYFIDDMYKLSNWSPEMREEIIKRDELSEETKKEVA